MASEAEWEAFAGLLQEYGGAVIAAANAAAGGEWQQATFEIRSADGLVWKTQGRVILPNGETVPAGSGPEIEERAARIWQVKDTLFSPPWYALRLVVQPTGKCDATFNHDPRCVDEAGFGDVQ